jgi:hypothetical protein
VNAPNRRIETTNKSTFSALWQEVYATLRPKAGRDGSATDCLNFLVNERLHALHKLDVSPTLCTIREAHWRLEELQRLNCKHPGCRPYSEQGPILVFEQGGIHLVIDGSNRVNLWRATRAEGLRRLIVITRNTSALDSHNVRRLPQPLTPELYWYSTEHGTFYIRSRRDGRWDLLQDDEELGSYAAPHEALEALTAGQVRLQGAADGFTPVVPHSLSDWARGT